MKNDFGLKPENFHCILFKTFRNDPIMKYFRFSSLLHSLIVSSIMNDFFGLKPRKKDNNKQKF
ncbi:hypothetical protein BpHYR1_005216 [Brachionus plicatilis]|uniref:Uncharacterized protein n=1 Tax=Brachionus plicatilis TaxID=10195 RepID=A0A3M7PRS3_BRAPC|nr:hypothetical protein BpHYR1_005216 [Brachionus plicatilis]